MNESKMKLIALKTVELVFSLVMVACMMNSKNEDLNSWLVTLNVFSLLSVAFAFGNLFIPYLGIGTAVSDLIYIIVAAELNSKTKNLTSLVVYFKLGLSSSIISLVIAFIGFGYEWFVLHTGKSSVPNRPVQNSEGNDSASIVRPIKENPEIDVIKTVKMTPQNFFEYFSINSTPDFIEISPKMKCIGRGVDIFMVYSLNGRRRNLWLSYVAKPIHLDAKELGLEGDISGIVVEIKSCWGEINLLK